MTRLGTESGVMNLLIFFLVSDVLSGSSKAASTPAPSPASSCWWSTSARLREASSAPSVACGSAWASSPTLASRTSSETGGSLLSPSTLVDSWCPLPCCELLVDVSTLPKTYVSTLPKTCKRKRRSILIFDCQLDTHEKCPKSIHWYTVVFARFKASKSFFPLCLSPFFPHFVFALLVFRYLEHRLKM